MKKFLSLLVVTVVLATGCKTAMQKDAITAAKGNTFSFEYEAMTRGSFKKIIVTQDTVVTIKDRAMKDVVTKKLSSADWSRLLADVQKVNLETIQDLKAPTDKRQYDGAQIGMLKIIKDGKTYQSNGFDHGMPPAEIKSIVDKLIAVSDLPKK